MLPLLIIASLFISFSTPANAAKPSFSVRPVYNPSGSFGFCLGDYDYPDGRKMTLALSPSHQINLGLTIPEGHFQVGAKYDLSLGIDGQEGRKIRAEALDETTLLFQVGVNPSFQKKLAVGKVLHASSGKRTVDFDLPAMQPVFDGLKKCVKEKADSRDERAAKAEQAMPELLKALLVTSGFTDIRPLLLDGVPVDERPADYIWKTGNLVAGIRERAAPEGKSLYDIIGLHMQGLKTRCNGAFKADIGREQSFAGLTLRLAEANCTPKKDSADRPVAVALLFYLTPSGGFTVFTHEGPEAVKKEALEARDKLAKQIIALAKNELAAEKR